MHKLNKRRKKRIDWQILLLQISVAMNKNGRKDDNNGNPGINFRRIRQWQKRKLA